MTQSNFAAPFPVVQIAFVVPDARAAALAHSKRYGSGPFFLVEHYQLSMHRYRGKETPIDVTSAYGQWGTVTAEFIQQHDDRPSAYRDLVKAGETRMHHVAVYVDDLKTQMATYEAQGAQAALYAEAIPGLGYAIMDTSSQLGIMTEFYEEWTVKPLYDHMRRSAVGFDGSNPVRILSFADLAVPVPPTT
jgi:catechol 2,3-dioxygenase-like lactoylglutathione lyase family enzyme